MVPIKARRSLMGKRFDLMHDEIHVGLALLGRHAGRDRKDVLATGSLALA